MDLSDKMQRAAKKAAEFVIEKVHVGQDAYTPEQINTMKEALRMAEVLTAAMATAEGNGADFKAVLQPWEHLNRAMVAVYASGALPKDEPPETGKAKGGL